MKNLFVLLLLSLFSVSGFAQSNAIENFNMERKLAIKTNPLKYLILDFDVGVEYFINQKTSIDVGLNIANDFQIIEISSNGSDDLFFGGIARYKMWNRAKNEKTSRKLFLGFYMAPGLALGTSQNIVSIGTTPEELEEYLNSEKTNNRYIAVLYDLGMSLEYRRFIFEAYAGIGASYNTKNTTHTSFGSILYNDWLLGRIGMRFGYTL